MLRAVIDTNVVISGFFGGKPYEVMRMWRDGRLLLCLSDEIVAEYLEVLARFERVTSQDVRELLGLLTDPERTLYVEPRERVSEIAADPADNMFLACALAANAHAIVSGDEHLRELGAFRGIPIVTPAGFLEMYADG